MDQYRNDGTRIFKLHLRSSSSSSNSSSAYNPIRVGNN